jgi:hypothetical protein
MGNMVTGHRFLAGDFAYSCHDDPLPIPKGAYYISVPDIFLNVSVASSRIRSDPFRQKT